MTNSNSWYRKEYLLGLGGLGGGAGGILIAGGPIATSGDAAYQISKSLRFNDDDTAYLRATRPHKGNQRIYTFSGWIKLGATGGGRNIFTVSADPGQSGSVARTEFAINGSGKLVFGVNSAGSSWKSVETIAALKDPAAWYHICVAVDTTNTVETERVKIYVNGKVQILVNNYPTQDEATPYNAAGYGHGVGTYINNFNDYFDGLMTDVYMIDGLRLSPAAFGSFGSKSSVWNPTVFTLPTPNDGTTWSSGGTTVGNWNEPTYGVGEIFDGNVLGTPGGACSDTNAWNGARYTLPSTVTVKSQVRVFTNGTDTRWGFDIGNGFEKAGAITPVGSAAPYSWTLPQTTEFKGICCSDAQQIFGIEVDGIVLVDGQTDLATRSNPNNGTVWSSSLSLSAGNFHNSHPQTSAFDGSLSTGSAPAAYNGTHQTLTFSPALSGSHRLRVYAADGDSNTVSVYVNGSDTGINLPSTQANIKWVDLGSHSDVSTIKMHCDNASAISYLRAVEVDDHILVDSSVDNSFNLKFNNTTRLANLGIDIFNGKIADATGALPIYNTTGDYGDVKGSGNRTDSDSANLKLAIAGDAFTDSSGNSVNVSATNATVSTTESRFYGSSINFDTSATNQYLTTGSGLWSANGNATFEAWLWVNDFGQERTIMHTAASEGDSFCDISIMGDKQIRIHPESSNAMDTPSIIPLQQWFHFALVQSSSDRKVYIDGIEQTMTIVAGSPKTVAWAEATDTMYIGNNNMRYYYSGYMNDIRVYDKQKYTANFKPPIRNDFTVNNIISSSATTGDDGPWASGFKSGGSDWDGGTDVTDLESGDSHSTSGNNSMLQIDTSLLGDHDLTFTKTSGDNIHFYSSSSSGSGYSEVASVSTSLRLTNTATPSHSYNRYVRLGGAGGGNAVFTITGVTDQPAGTSQDTRDLDVLIDSPTTYAPDDEDTGVGGEVRGNYATLSSISKGMDCTLSQGGLQFAYGTSTDLSPSPATMGMAKGSGKFYWELEVTEAGQWCHGIVNTTVNHSTSSSVGTGYYIGHNTTGWGVNGWGQGVTHNNATSKANYLGTGDISSSFTGYLGFAFDADNGNLWVHKDGTWGASATTTEVVNGTTTNAASSTITVGDNIFWFPAVSDGNGGAAGGKGTMNFGQRPFKYAAPTGYKCLCTFNLPDTFGASDNALEDKNDPSKYFDTKIWGGDGTAAHDIKGFNFQPDMVWLKRRDDAGGHHVRDAIRGATKSVFPNTDEAEGTDANIMSAFTSDGFTLGTGANTNTNAGTYVGWAWDAGTAAATPSTEGSITPSGQWVNDTAGFSISKYTGTEAAATVGHGLSKAPELVIVKNLGAGSSNWLFWHNEMAATEQLYTNSTDGVATGQTNTWNSTKPSSTVISLNASWWSNDSGVEHIAYCFTSIAGYSAFGAYTGNGSTDGTFVHTGFTPRYLIIKRTTGPSDWIQLDTERRDYNTNNQTLFPNKNDSTAAQQDTDFLSNGFKLRNTSGGSNTSGGTYYYMAWAENPFKTARASY